MRGVVVVGVGATPLPFLLKGRRGAFGGFIPSHDTPSGVKLDPLNPEEMVTPWQGVGINVAKRGESGTVPVCFALSEDVSGAAEYLKAFNYVKRQVRPKTLRVCKLMSRSSEETA